MAYRQKHGQDSGSSVTVVVMEKDADIRRALRHLLRHAGYPVAETESLRQAEILIDASLRPLVLIVGDGETAEETRLRFFTAVAANPVTNHVYAYLISTPERWKLPSLVEMLGPMETATIDLPHELASFLAVVADAAARAADTRSR